MGDITKHLVDHAWSTEFPWSFEVIINTIEVTSNLEHLRSKIADGEVTTQALKWVPINLNTEFITKHNNNNNGALFVTYTNTVTSRFWREG